MNLCVAKCQIRDQDMDKNDGCKPYQALQDRYLFPKNIVKEIAEAKREA